MHQLGGNRVPLRESLDACVHAGGELSQCVEALFDELPFSVPGRRTFRCRPLGFVAGGALLTLAGETVATKVTRSLYCCGLGVTVTVALVTTGLIVSVPFANVIL